jgi:CBS domain containing-hemolysin-like protein
MGGTEVNPVEQMLGKALTAIYERAQKRGIVASDLTHLAENHFELGDTLVRELMVPRTDMVWVERDKTLRQGLSLALRSGYSRIPVAGEDLDNIIGIAYVKDLAKRALDHHEAETTEKVEQHMRPPVFVPENKEAGDLLRDMQRDQIHLAIVIDEYGGTAGIITIEDIIEEIVGEIADEYDDGIESFTWISEVKARAKAGIHIEDLAEELKISIDEADYEGIDTIGGLMAQRLGRVPIAGSSITIDGWTITSERPIGRRRRISSVMIEKVQEAETESE